MHKLISTCRTIARGGSYSFQRLLWPKTPLNIEKAGHILRRYDPKAEVVRAYASWCCQAFEVTFRGQHCVAKFAGRDFEWKFALQGEVARLVAVKKVGARVPDVIFEKTQRVTRPFYIMPHSGEVEKDDWDMARRHDVWNAQADLIQQYPEIVARARLGCTSLSASEEIARNEISATRSGLREIGLPEDEYRDVIKEYEQAIFSEPWVAGQWQAPYFLHDGRHCWCIDWSDTMMVPPLRWIMDYTLYPRINRPEIGNLHMDFLLERVRTADSRGKDAAAVYAMQRYKVLYDGIGLIRRENNWAYFGEMHQRILGSPLPTPIRKP